MSSFTDFDGALDVRYYSALRLFELRKELRFYVGAPEQEQWIICGKGFLSDGASTPIGMRWAFERFGPHAAAVFIHDKMCDDLHTNRLQPFYATHRQRCRIFAEALAVPALCVPAWKQRIGVIGVRIGGPRNSDSNRALLIQSRFNTAGLG